MANNTCFLECKELLFGDMVLLWVLPLGAGEKGSCTTFVNVVYNAVERLGGGGTGLQHCPEFLEPAPPSVGEWRRRQRSQSSRV
jgi:hypothetical protein